MRAVSDPFNISNHDVEPTQPFNIGSACTAVGADSEARHHRVAVVVDQADGGSLEMTYAELNGQSNRFAGVLRDAGLISGDRVLIWLPNRIEFPVVFFGALKLGAVAVPASMLLTATEVQFLQRNSGARALVTTKDLLSRLQEHDFDFSGLDAIWLVDESESDRALNRALQKQSDRDWDCTTLANDPAYLVYTSGTTGYPKGVLHAHRALLGRLPAARNWFHYDPENVDRVLHTGKFNWTYVLGTGLMDPLFLGKTVIVYNGDATPSVWPQLIARHRASIFIAVPTLYRQIIQKTDFGAKDVPSLRHCMCAGEHLSGDVLRAWQSRFEQPIYEAIGMSECSYYLSQHPSYPLKPGSAGRPQPGHRIALLDQHMQPVADEEEGMLCIHKQDLGLFLEYWQAPDEMAEASQGDYFLTGDYARRDRDGDFWFLGRRDDMINTFGYRVSPVEVERVIKTHPHITDCVALQETVATDKHILTVCVITGGDTHSHPHPSESDIIAFAAEELAAYKVPKRVVFCQQFPRTANGKVLRSALRDQLALS